SYIVLNILSFFLFFFQAEDGIRDRNVTGVQTCALPICITDQQAADKAKEFLSHFEEVAAVRAVNHDGELVVAVEVKHHDRFSLRSEERRVGKEGRCRGWREQ